MTVTASIQFVQPGGGGTGTVGQALIGLVALPVTIHNGDDTNVVNTTFELIDTPTGSAIAVGVAQDGALKTYAFTPDIPGGYDVHIITTDAQGNSAEDYRVFQVLETSGRLIPPFRGDASSLNFAGQKFGWAPYLRAYLKKLDVLAAAAPIRPTVTIAAYNIDFTLGDVFKKTLGAGAQVFTFSGAVTGQSINVEVTGAASTLTWPTHKKAGGVALVQTAAGTDWYTIIYDGTDYTIAQGPVNVS